MHTHQNKKIPINFPTTKSRRLIFDNTKLIDPVSISLLIQLFDKIETNKYPKMNTNNRILEYAADILSFALALKLSKDEEMP